MNKVITINLNGNAYQLEESGYDALQAYLDGAAWRLQNNPDRDEIIADIEQAIADKFRGVLGKFKSVVETKEVLAIIAEMGPVLDDSAGTEENVAGASGFATSGTGAAEGSKKPESGNPGSMPKGTPGAGSTEESGGPARRLYKIPEGAMLAGVCNGIAAYFGFDVMAVRMVFVVFSVVLAPMGLLAHWLFIIPILLYVVLALTLPTADTPAERAAARGDPSTAQEYIRRAKAGYYESVKSFTQPSSRKEWKRRFKQEMRGKAYRWNQYGAVAGANAPVRTIAPAMAIPFIGIFEVVILLFWLFQLINLITKGNVLGIALPTDVPLWIGIVVMIFALQIILWPLKAMRYACYVAATGQTTCAYPPTLLGTLFGFVILGASIWLADHYIPQVHEFLVMVPGQVDHLADAFRQWWNNR